MGRTGLCLDVEPRVARPRDMNKIDAVSPDDARRALREYGICELLGHGASQPTQTGRPDAKNTCESKLPVAGHDLWPGERL